MKKRNWIIGALALAAAAALAVLTLTGPGGSGAENKNGKWAGKSPEEIVSSLTLSQKAAQMVLPACYNVTERMMRENGYGGILSQGERLDAAGWRAYVDRFQQAALASPAGIPYLYGQDDVHGVNYARGTVIFPHNIGLGAADDEELTCQAGKITADEALQCHMLWNYAPCVAQSADPRWGRTYESYGADLDVIRRLSAAYTRGFVEMGGVICAKHFLADGNVRYGTGENPAMGMLLDRGNAELGEEEIAALLEVYKAQIDAGAQTVMISHSALNGVKMHENAKYIRYLKNEMGFQGFIVSDWDSVQNTSPRTYYDQVVTSVNAGIDMLMEVERFEEARQIIVQAVEKGDIAPERVDDAVTRILRVKKNAGILDDPLGEKLKTSGETGSAAAREVARKLVEKSLVLVKNEGNVLPLKAGASVYVLGPAADDASAQCGGWTVEWNGSPEKRIPGVTTLLEGLREAAKECGVTVLTDEKDAEKADAVLLFVGEKAYAEWNGDTPDLALCGRCGLPGNSLAIRKAKELNKPTVACIVAGRQVLIGDYEQDWDGIVMCYLPGSEGQGVANVLLGKADFTGRLPSPWYTSVRQIGTEECWLEKGFGLAMGLQ